MKMFLLGMLVMYLLSALIYFSTDFILYFINPIHFELSDFFYAPLVFIATILSILYTIIISLPKIFKFGIDKFKLFWYNRHRK